MIPQGHQAGEATHERKDVDVIGLAMIAILLLLLLAISFLGVWGVIHFLNDHRKTAEPHRAEVSGRLHSFPEPRLEVVPGKAMAKTRIVQDAELNSYGWVDRRNGIAHIPIAQAMELLVQRGLPEVGAGQTRQQLMQARPQTNVQPKEPIAAPTPEASP